MGQQQPPEEQVSPFWQQVVIGSVIVLAVAVDELRKRRRTT